MHSFQANRPRERDVIEQLYDGQTTRIPHRVRIRCCACGLAHVFHFKPRSNGIRLTVWRDLAGTKRNRQLKKYKHVKKVKWPL